MGSPHSGSDALPDRAFVSSRVIAVIVAAAVPPGVAGSSISDPKDSFFRKATMRFEEGYGHLRRWHSSRRANLHPSCRD